MARKRRKILWIFLGFLLIVVLVFGVSRSNVKTLIGGKIILLPPDVQKAIQNEAVKELTQGADYKHTDVVAQVNNEDIKDAQATILPNNPLYLFKKAGRRIQEFFT